MAEAEAEAEAKIPDDDATSRPPLRDIVGLGRSQPQDPPGLCALDNAPPSTPMAPPPPKSRCTPRNPAPSALAAPRAHDADMSPRPSAPPLELLMEDGFFDDEQTSDDPPTCNAPPPRDDEGGPDRTPLAEATVIAMPVCEAVQMAAGPAPAQDDEDNDARAGWSVKCWKFVVIGVASLVLLALGTLIGVVVVFAKQDDTVMTSTSSTAIMISTAGTAILTSTTSAATATSASSPSSTTSPEIYTVSD